jgi:enoyl-CoA hydratase
MSSGTIGRTRVGVPFPTVALEMVRHAVGPATAGLVLGAGTMSAADAQHVGLVDEVVHPDELMDRALREAERLARIPAATFAMTKSQLRREVVRRIDADERPDSERLAAAWTSTEVPAAIIGFLEALAAHRR